MRLIPDDQYQMGGALDDDDDEPRLPVKRKYDDKFTEDTENMESENMEQKTDQMKQVEQKMENYDTTIKRKRIERDGEKIIRLIKIALKIAKKDAYDDQMRILDIMGRPIDGTYLPTLLKYIVTPQKIIIGEDDFIRILHDADIDPEWITNENVRARLKEFDRKSFKHVKRPKPPSPPDNKPNLSDPQFNFSNSPVTFTQPNSQNPSEYVHKRRNKQDSRNFNINLPSSSNFMQPKNSPLPDDDDDDELL